MSSLPLGVIVAAAQIGLDSILVKPYRAIGSFVAQVVLEEIHQDTLEITDHPVDQGAVISDHAFKRPSELVVKCAWSNSPTVAGLIDGVVGGLKTTISGAQSLLSGNSENQVRDIYDKLLKLQESRVPFDVFTGKRIYTNMLVQSLSVTTDKQSENSLMVTATLRQVLIVATQTLTVAAPASRQTNPSATAPPINSGAKALTPAPRYQGVE